MEIKIIPLLLVIALSGCASTKELEKKAQNHDKAGDYYESIGQPDAAKEERKTAGNNRDDASKLGPFLIQIYENIKKKQ